MSGARRPLQFYPGLAAFTDAVEALPQETIRHFTLLREVDAKACGPEELLRRCINHALLLSQSPSEVASLPGLNPPPPHNERDALMEDGPSAAQEIGADTSAFDHNRRTRLQQIRIIISDLLLTLDEKIHVISTASEALAKHMVRVDDAYETTAIEIDPIVRDGNPHHWAYGNSTSDPAGGQRQGANGAHAASVGNTFAYSNDVFPVEPSLAGAVGLSGTRGRHDSGAKRHAQIQDLPDPRISGIASAINHGDPASSGHDRSPLVPNKRRKGATQGGQSKASASDRPQTAIRPTGNPNIPNTQTIVGSGSTKKTSSYANSISNSSTKNSGSRKKAPGQPLSAASSPVKQNFSDLQGGNSNQDKTTVVGAGLGAKSAARNPRSKAHSSKAEGAKPSAKPELDPNQDNKIPSFGSGFISSQRLPPETVVHDVSDKTIQSTKTGSHDKQGATRIQGFVEQPIRAPAKDDKPQPPAAVLTAPGEKLAKSGDSGDGMAVKSSSIHTSNRSMTKAPSLSDSSKASQPNSRKAASSRSSKTGKGPLNKDKEGGPAEDEGNIVKKGNSGDAEEDVEEGEDEEGDPDEMRYCYCNQVSYGRMVACDGPGCKREWFHLPCVGLTHMPSTKDKWFCNDCRAANVHGPKQVKAGQSKG